MEGSGCGSELGTGSGAGDWGRGLAVVAWDCGSVVGSCVGAGAEVVGAGVVGVAVGCGAVGAGVVGASEGSGSVVGPGSGAWTIRR